MSMTTQPAEAVALSVYRVALREAYQDFAVLHEIMGGEADVLMRLRDRSDDEVIRFCLASATVNFYSTMRDRSLDELRQVSGLVDKCLRERRAAFYHPEGGTG